LQNVAARDGAGRLTKPPSSGPPAGCMRSSATVPADWPQKEMCNEIGAKPRAADRGYGTCRPAAAPMYLLVTPQDGAARRLCIRSRSARPTWRRPPRGPPADPPRAPPPGYPRGRNRRRSCRWSDALTRHPQISRPRNILAAEIPGTGELPDAVATLAPRPGIPGVQFGRKRVSGLGTVGSLGRRLLPRYPHQRFGRCQFNLP
jgi:hypothetical protein